MKNETVNANTDKETLSEAWDSLDTEIIYLVGQQQGTDEDGVDYFYLENTANGQMRRCNGGWIYTDDIDGISFLSEKDGAEYKINNGVTREELDKIEEDNEVN